MSLSRSSESPRQSGWLGQMAVPFAFLAIGVAVATHEQTAGERRPIASSYGAGPHGVRAFHQALLAAGVRVERSHQPFTELPGGSPHLLVIAAPSGEEIGAGETRSLLQWIEKGNALLYLADGERTEVEGEAPDRRLLEQLGIELKPALTHPFDPSVSGEAIPTVGPVSPTPYTYGCAGIYTGASGGAEHEAPMRLPLFADHGVEYGTLIPQGSGQVFFFASTAPIVNRSIGWADNAAALFAIVHSIPGLRSVLIDEYHHGRSSSRTWQLLLAHPAFLRAAAQAAVLAGLFLWVSSRRFGPVRDLPADPRRTSTEFISSMAGLYARAGPSGANLRAILRGIRYDLWRRHGVPVRASGDAAAARLAAIAGRGVEEVRTLMAECEALVARPRVAREELLGAVRRLHDTFERKGP